MTTPNKVVFLFDVDNTLLDNDRVTADLRRHLETEVGSEGSRSYWNIFEQLRSELGYADYLGALQRYRSENPHDPHLFTVSHFLIGYPFDGNTAAPGNGPMTAFLASTRAIVDQCHAIALAHGGTCEGPPGLRAHYHPHYYGAYFRDPDGNKLAVACHAAPPQA